MTQANLPDLIQKIAALIEALPDEKPDQADWAKIANLKKEAVASMASLEDMLKMPAGVRQRCLGKLPFS